MSHLPILPVLIPFLAAGVLLSLHGADSTAKRSISALSIVMLLAASVTLVVAVSDGQIRPYRLGNWPAPYGIVLVADRLSALMVMLTSLLAAAVLAASITENDTRGRHFHPFLQLQIAGLNGAFLTGDLFNLFVFFEILLLASYALLAHGGGLARTRAGLAYVILNLTGSSLFLIALGLVYGSLGTLNMADLAVVLPTIAVTDQALVRTALALLTAVFVLKAALLPLGFWLPHVYAAATLPVAALFVIMTKVGIYSLLRLSTIGLSTAPYTADLLQPWLPWLAIATIALGVLGALAASRLVVVIANLVMMSSGTLLLGISAGTPLAYDAMLFYLVNTTIAVAGLFLTTDLLARQRGKSADTYERGPRLEAVLLTGGAYLLLALAATGMPPLPGFLAKIMVMQSVWDTASGKVAWAALIISGFVVALVLARAASVFFWEPGKAADGSARVTTSPTEPTHTVPNAGALVGLVALTVSLAIFAPTVAGYTRATAAQLVEPARYVAAVLGNTVSIKRERRP